MDIDSIQALFEMIQYETECEFGEVLEEVGINPKEISYVRSFEEAGMLTNDSGFVVKMKSGTEFHVTVQSRY